MAWRRVRCSSLSSRCSAWSSFCCARRNTQRLLAEGGIEFGRSHYRWMVALHSAWLVGLWWLGHGRSVDPLLLGVFILLQAGRLWVIASLGRRWTTRIIVLPRAPLVCKRAVSLAQASQLPDRRAGNSRGSAGAGTADICRDFHPAQCMHSLPAYPHRKCRLGAGGRAR